MPDRIRSIVIVGGEAAAASVAAGIANALRETGVKVTLVDDPSTYTGVSSTLPATVTYHKHMGLNEESLVRATGATFKLGYEYVGWGHADNRFLVSTGSSGPDIRLVPFHQFIVRDGLRGGSAKLADYSLATQLIESGRFQPPSNDASSVSSNYRYSLHLDRQRYAMAMAGVATGFGVDVRVTNAVSAKRRTESGFVESLLLADGSEVYGDLFVDCSGERALLIGETLGVPLDDWSKFLPCDSSVSVESSDVFDTQPVTRIIAKQHGWMRRLQFMDKSHFEYFFSSDTCDEETVHSGLAADVSGATGVVQSRRITRGCRTTPWSHNVIAIGRAAADFESLESSSVTRAHKAALRLLALLPDRSCQAAIAAEYNRLVREETLQIRDLIAMCYARAGRHDAGFWQQSQQLDVPPAVQQRLQLFESQGRFLRHAHEAAGLEHHVALLMGLGCRPKAYNPLVDAVSQQFADARMQQLRALVVDAVKETALHDDYLRKILRPAQ